MPDSKKLSRMGAKDEMEMVKEDTEEFLSLLSDSETSISSPRSPGISPTHSSLTLEQFTNIVLAKEKFDTFNSASEIPVTVDETVEPASGRGGRQIILPKTPASHSNFSIQQKRSAVGEKLKPVVLTPRQIHVQAVPNSHPPPTIKVRQNTFIPKQNSSHLSKNLKRNISQTLPLYESIFSLAGSPGTQKNHLNLISESQVRGGGAIPDQRVNDQIRKQLESVIKRNEDILKNTDLLKQDVQRRTDKTCQPDNSTPLNLSVRKDLMKSHRNPNAEQEKRNLDLLPRDLSQAVASLITKTGGDLEITRKVKKAGKPRKSFIYDTPALVNMTPIYRPKSRENIISIGEELDSLMGKRKAYYKNEDAEENIKKRKLFINDSIKEELLSIDSRKIKEENLPMVNKIGVDCRLALHPDLHGNYPLHNAALLSNINLVKRFSLVLAALKKSVDLVNRNGMTPLHLSIQQNNPVIVGELLQFSASPSACTTTGDTCYHLAARHGDAQCMGVLLKHVPDRPEVNLFNDQGQTALHLALLSGKEAVVKMLLAYGAKPDIQELKSGKTGLLLALEQGNQSMAELLICYGANMSVPSWGGVTPASLCSENRKHSEQYT